MSEPQPAHETPPPGPTFDQAIRNVVSGLQESISEFERLLAAVPEAAYTDAEWGIIENTAAEIESLIEQVELDYEMAAYDSEAWYEIMKDLPRVTRMIGDTMHLMRSAAQRSTPPP